MNGAADGRAGRIYGLDILRACAILTVVVAHAGAVTDNPAVSAFHRLLTFDGVSIFFVLSGYLIGGILLNMLAQPDFGARATAGFLLRRWLRTLPAYYLVLALLTGSVLLHWQPPPPRWHDYVLFLQNFAWPHPDFFGEAWSLSIEEWFYLLLPLALLLSAPFAPPGKRHAVLLGWTIACLVAVPLYRLQVAQLHGYPDLASWDNWLRKTVLTRLDAIAWGVLGAWLQLRGPRLWRSSQRLTFGLGLGILFADWLMWHNGPDFNPFYLNTLTLPAQSLGTLLLLPALSALRGGSGAAYRFFTFISLISYPLYLVHLGLVQLCLLPRLSAVWFYRLEGWQGQAAVYLLYWALCLFIAWVIHHFYEQPIMDWRDRHIRKVPAVS